jgi:putative DNA primase/helicase
VANETEKPSGLNITELSDYLSAIVPKSPAGKAVEVSAGAEIVPLRLVLQDGQAIKDEEEFGGRGGGPPTGGAGGDRDEPVPTWASDDSLAVLIKQAMNGVYRYVPEWKQWMRYEAAEGRWSKAVLDEAVEIARRVCRKTSERITSGHLARQVSSEKTVKAALRLAGSGPEMGLALSHTAFDADAWSLGTPGGVINLRTGQLLPAQPEYYITKTTAVAPFGGEKNPCPLWHKFLGEFTCGDQQEIDFLQRVAGYCAVGELREHAIFFLWGPRGGEGKGVFARMVARVLGSYAINAMAGLFEVQKGERHPTELAHLEGARLILCSEVQRGSQWNEPLLNQFSGGDPITARRIAGNPFTFLPTGKLMFLGNYKPRMVSGGAGLLRRMQLKKCAFVPPMPDLELENKLWEERAAILCWIIEGALLWARHGLRPPPSVVRETEIYFREQDVVRRWVWERCTIETIDEQGEPFHDRDTLMADYAAWATRQDETVLSRRRFYEALGKHRGVYAKERFDARIHKRGFAGLRLMPILADDVILAMRHQREDGKNEATIAAWVQSECRLELSAAQVAHAIERAELTGRLL